MPLPPAPSTHMPRELALDRPTMWFNRKTQRPKNSFQTLFSNSFQTLLSDRKRCVSPMYFNMYNLQISYYKFVCFTCIHIYVCCVHIYPNIYNHTCTYIYIFTHAQTHFYEHTRTYIYTNTYTNTNTNTHILTYAHALSRAQIYI